MIESDQELAIVKEQIEYLRGCRDLVFKQADSDPFMMHISASAFENKMRSLYAEVDAYEARLAQPTALGGK